MDAYTKELSKVKYKWDGDYFSCHDCEERAHVEEAWETNSGVFCCRPCGEYLDSHFCGCGAEMDSYHADFVGVCKDCR